MKRSIFVLTVWNIEGGYGDDFYFSNLEKAIDFINNNFNWDNPRKITSENFEGKTNQYIIKDWMVDPKRL